MPGYFRRGACSLAVVLFFSGVASAQVLASSGRQLEPGAWKLIPYYQGTYRQDLKFSIASSGVCVGGNPANAFACNTSGDVKVHASGGLGLVKLLAQPWDHVQYWVAGGLGSASLNIPGSAVATSKEGGWAFFGGATAVIVPDTMVTPSVSLDLSYGLQRYALDAIGPSAIDQRLDLHQLQAALVAAHRFEFSNPRFVLEPYGGVKWLRTQAVLTDNQTGGQSGGHQDTFTPFAGLQFPVWDHETLFIEASFVNGVQYAAGAHIRFK